MLSFKRDQFSIWFLQVTTDYQLRKVDLYLGTYLDNSGEVFAVDIIVRLEKHLSQAALAHWVVFGVKLVKTVEGVSILAGKQMIG